MGINLLPSLLCHLEGPVCDEEKLMFTKKHKRNLKNTDCLIFLVNTISLIVPDPLWDSPSQPRNQTTTQDRSVSMRTCLLWIIHGITIQLPVQYNTLPVIGKQHNWSWGNYPWQPWPGEKLGHGCYNSPDTLLVTVRKGQTESSVHQANSPDTRPHETSRLSNTSTIIGVPLQLASKSQTL